MGEMSLTEAARDSAEEVEQAPSEEEAPSLDRALACANGGNFHQAAQMLRALDRGPTPIVRLLEALGKYAAARNGAHRECRLAFDAMADAQEADVEYSTFTLAPPSSDPARLTAPYELGGDGRTVITTRYLFLETLPKQRAVIALRQPLPAGKDLFIHVFLHCTGNIEDNLYLMLGGPEHEEAIRFSNTGVTLCNDGAMAFYTPKTAVLVSISLSAHHVALYLNGCLRVRRKRPGRPTAGALRFELRGSASADLAGLVLGLEIWSRSAADGASGFESFGRPEEDLFDALVDERLTSLDGGALFDVFNSVEEVRVANLPARLVPVLDRLIDTRPYREEVMETLVRQLPEKEAEGWLNANLPRLPAPIIAVEDVTVEFSRAPHRLMALGRILRRRDPLLFHVLEGISFNLYPGDILGIIGENGAGKSTLLRTIASLIPIKKGEIFVGGQHVLLRAGVGFREEATGRENIFLAGSYLQLNPGYIRNIVDDIIAFAELEHAIDQPFKYYSDGMKARLIFSLATCITPEILMLDEPLGAGDARFRDKAAKRMDELMLRAKAAIIVTHGVDFVRNHCTKALYLVKGRKAYFGDPNIAVNHYLNDLHLTGSGSDA
jgi:ABC-type polysaccharide/polyol phosphate transport system ATPase subunit